MLMLDKTEITITMREKRDLICLRVFFCLLSPLHSSENAFCWNHHSVEN